MSSPPHLPLILFLVLVKENVFIFTWINSFSLADFETRGCELIARDLHGHPQQACVRTSHVITSHELMQRFRGKHS
jgi:hypothetical protein